MIDILMGNVAEAMGNDVRDVGNDARVVDIVACDVGNGANDFLCINCEATILLFSIGKLNGK